MKGALPAASVAALCLIVAACGGAGGGAGASSTGTVPQAKGTLNLHISIPGSSAVASAKTAAARRAFSAASSTSGILFTVYTHGGSPTTPLSVNGADISSGSSLCQPSGTGRVCTIPIAAPAGTVDILAQTYDQVIPATGTVPGGAHLLAAGVAGAVVVTAGVSSSVNLTANPVLSSVSLGATPAVVRTLVASTVTASVYGFDAGGNLILAGNYVDQYGNPVNVSIGVSPNPNNSVSLSTSSFSGSGQSTQLSYTGASDTSGSLALTSNPPFPATLHIGLVAPTTVVISDPNLSGSLGGWQGIAELNGGGSAQNYVFYSTLANRGVSFVDAGSNAPGFTNIPNPQTPNPIATNYPIFGDVALDSNNGAFYFGNFGTNYITWQSFFSSDPPSPAQPQTLATCTPTAGGQCYATGQIATELSGTALYGTGNVISQWRYGGTATQLGTYTFPGVAWAGAFWDYVFPHGRLWMTTSQSGGQLYEIDASNAITVTSSFMYSATPSGGAPWGVTADPRNHNAWITIPNAKQVAKYTDPINTTTPTTFATLGAPQYITSDLNAVWFTEATSAGVSLGRIDLVTNVLAEYPLVALPGAQAGPILSLENSGTSGTEVAVVVYSGSASPGEVVLVVP